MILVTGSTGTTGREVVNALQGRSPIRRGVRQPKADAADEVRLDFADPGSFAAALDGVKAVYLLRPPQLGRPSAMQPFIDAVKRANVERIVFLSVKGAGSNPLLPHRGIEKRIEASDIAYTHLRPADFMQNFETVHRDDIRDDGEIWAPAGTGRASWVDVRDVALATATALTEQGHAGRAYTLTGPEALDCFQAAEILSAHVGHRVVYRNPSIASFLARQRRLGRATGLSMIMSAIYTAQRLGLAAGLSLDLERLIGRPPATLDAYVRRNAQIWRRNKVGAPETL